LVTAFDDGDVAAMRIGARGELGLKAFVRGAVIETGGALPCLDLHQHLRQIAIRSGPTHQGDVRSPLENFLALLLSDTTEHSKFLALALQLLVVGKAVENLLLGLVTNGASVVEDEVGLLDGRDLAIALGDERTNDLFRVMGIHLTAERFNVEGLAGPRRHKGKYNPGNRGFQEGCRGYAYVTPVSLSA